VERRRQRQMCIRDSGRVAFREISNKTAKQEKFMPFLSKKGIVMLG
jgi:hypothetical protein